MRFLMWGLLGLTLMGCSGGGGGGVGPDAPTSPTDGAWPSYSVEAASDLPTCVGSIIGRLYYVEDQDVFKVCKTSGWATVQMGSRARTVTSCSKTAGGLDFRYSVVDFSSNDKFVTCSISGAAVQIANSFFWRAGQNGAVAEACLLVYDVDSSATSGFWAFSLNGGVRNAVYSDPGSADDQSQVMYSSGDCTIN